MYFQEMAFSCKHYLSAIDAQEKGWGLLHWVAIHEWAGVMITLLVLDLVIYAQHVLTHKWMPLWHLHQVHHIDLDFDATTAVRFHPLEIIVSLIIKVALIYTMPIRLLPKIMERKSRFRPMLQSAAHT